MAELISIHRALAELKTLDKRIQRAVNNKVVTYNIGSEAPRGYKDVDNFKEEAKAGYQSAKDLIERRNKIKAAITASNAVTKVLIAGVEMTVAEAIDRRDTGLQYDKLLLQSLQRQLNQVEREIDNEKVNMEHRLEQRIQSDLGTKDRKANADEVENITNAFLKRYKPNELDPIGIREEIRKLTESIEEFEMQVDYTLSESNTSTKIEV